MTVTKLNTGVWRARWTDHDGVRRSKTFPNKKFADQYDALQRAAAAKGVPVDKAEPEPAWKLALLEPLHGTTGIHVEAFDPRGCFVYLLWQDNQVVYVGASTNVLGRLGAHMTTPERRAMVTRVTMLRCYSPEHMIDVESRLIRQYRPVLNIAGRGAEGDLDPISENGA